MNPKEIARSYDAIASHWDGESFNRRNGISAHERAIRFVEDKDFAIDVGCGSSGRIIDLLLREGFEVEGLDISPEMLRLARLRHPNQLFHHADICDWEATRKYNFISAWDSIWHAPLANHSLILGKLCRSLAPHGVMIFSSGGVDTPGDGTNPFLGQPLYHAALGIPKLLELVSENGCICRHLEYDQFPEKHLYLIIQKAEQVVPPKSDRAGG